MSGSYLLDTNIIIALFARDPNVEERLRQADSVYLPSIAIGELFYGSYKSTRVEENLGRIESFAAQSAVLNCDSDTARHYGRIKDGLRRIGKPIPENDIWIAALTVQHDLRLVTRDAHFAEVGELTFENW
jgi:tRNA(fMet)-specific endonuclease VapC